MSVTYCGSKLDLGSQVRKFSEGIECFSVEAFDDLLDGEKKKIYTIIFNDGKE